MVERRSRPAAELGRVVHHSPCRKVAASARRASESQELVFAPGPSSSSRSELPRHASDSMPTWHQGPGRFPLGPCTADVVTDQRRIERPTGELPHKPDNRGRDAGQDPTTRHIPSQRWFTGAGSRADPGAPRRSVRLAADKRAMWYLPSNPWPVESSKIQGRPKNQA